MEIFNVKFGFLEIGIQYYIDKNVYYYAITDEGKKKYCCVSSYEKAEEVIRKYKQYKEEEKKYPKHTEIK